MEENEEEEKEGERCESRGPMVRQPKHGSQGKVAAAAHELFVLREVVFAVHGLADVCPGRPSPPPFTT